MFSPESGNSNNNILKVFGTNVLDQPFEFKLFNRWGEVVYFSDSFDDMNSQGWDGIHSDTGDPQDIGVYTYILTGTFEDGTEFEKVGNVTLVR